MDLVVLCMCWIGWCAAHSLLIDSSVTGLVGKHAAGLITYYRLLYNVLALVTIFPLILITKGFDGPIVLVWQGYYQLIRLVLLLFALLLFHGGAGKYDLGYFLGIKQLQTGEQHLLLADNDEFDETGVFGITRHPWYLASLFFLWSVLPRYRLPVFLAVCILSLYLVIGTVLEERKIVARFGDRYLRYRQRVSMLFPWKWLMRLL